MERHEALSTKRLARALTIKHLQANVLDMTSNLIDPPLNIGGSQARGASALRHVELVYR